MPSPPQILIGFSVFWPEWKVIEGAYVLIPERGRGEGYLGPWLCLCLAIPALYVIIVTGFVPF